MQEKVYEKVMESAEAVKALGGPTPRLGLVLGSGLGAFADGLEEAVSASYSELANFPVSAVAGHAGKLVVGKCQGVPVVVMQGRVHGYEGWSVDELAHGVRVMASLGIGALVLTNAAGGIHPDLKPGDLMRITDHLNLSGRSPLTGPNDERLGPRFPDMSHAYDPKHSDLLEAIAAEGRLALRRGVYACMPGPAYETPAEIRMLRAMGADAVGMSTAPEVLAVRHMGVPCIGISVITNLAAGIATSPLSHAEVKEVADQVKDRFISLLDQYVPALDASLAGEPKTD